MRAKILLPSLLLLAGLVLPLGSAQAITNGEPDGDGHPFVGLMLAKDADGVPLFRCTGTLLSSTLFLTAGHCTDGVASVEIFFEPGPIERAPGFDPTAPDPCDGVTGWPCTGDVSGTPHTHPQYDADEFYRYDLGVVVLDEPMAMPAYGELPELNQLDELKASRDTRFTAVGYGLQKSFPDAASHKDEATRVRMVAEPRLIRINKGFVEDFAVILSANADTGGTCSGDSGGPNFVGDSLVVGAVSSFANNATCAGQGGAYRIDRADDLGWLYGSFGAHLS